jgi:hypothetical protein
VSIGVEITSRSPGSTTSRRPRCRHRHQVAGVVPAEDRVEEEPVELAVDAPRGVDVAGCVGSTGSHG